MWKLDASIKKAEQLLLDLNYEAVEMAYVLSEVGSGKTRDYNYGHEYGYGAQQ